MTSMVRNMISGMSARERRLAALAGIVFVTMLLSLAIFLVRSSIADLEASESSTADALRLIAAKKQDYLAQSREQQRLANKRMSKPTPLRTLIDNIGEDLAVTIPDIKELADQRHAGGWVEHAAELSMRDVGLADLTAFMVEVKGNGRKFPIAITKLDIRKRRRSADSFDVKMTISTYEQSAAPEESGAGKKGGGASRGKGAR